ncbi:MAG: paraquat-inducible protein A [Psychromonas sp.]|nr:paraquat-inducible protein A [Psychromonas sp.]
MDKNAVAGITAMAQGLQLCKVCGNYSQQIQHPTCCPACGNEISQREKNSLQKTWAFLITALIFIIPANLYPITYLVKNSTLYPDTIYSGILTLIDNGLPVIAMIVFVASIMVPILKIIGLAVILLSIQKQWNLSPQKQLLAFHLIDWIGKWSILDLFVISIMVAVFDKGSLLSVYPGIAASSFTIVVLSTLFAANNFDTRLIWDAQKK